MSESDDAKDRVENECRPHCTRAWYEYEECVKRLEKDTSGEAHCTGQYLDFWHCIDHCAAKKLFKALK